MRNDTRNSSKSICLNLLIFNAIFLFLLKLNLFIAAHQWRRTGTQLSGDYGAHTDTREGTVKLGSTFIILISIAFITFKKIIKSIKMKICYKTDCSRSI